GGAGADPASFGGALRRVRLPDLGRSARHLRATWRAGRRAGRCRHSAEPSYSRRESPQSVTRRSGAAIGDAERQSPRLSGNQLGRRDVSILIRYSMVGTHTDPGVKKIWEQTAWPHEPGGIRTPPAGRPVASLTRSTPLNGYPLSRNQSQPPPAVTKSKPPARLGSKLRYVNTCVIVPVSGSSRIRRSPARSAQIDPPS